jgi:lipopolysaccharide/colanic/teichoic acid biosynthesis glycosyltransferase
MLKFRTMWGRQPDDESWEGAKPYDDPRVSSRFARFCRRYSIDELPQLVHVISGKMAFVGPRPLTRRELEHYYAEDTFEILTVRPGLTGLWQVTGRSRLTYQQRRRLDLFLVRHQLVRLYAGILLRTIPQVITGKNAW